MKRCSPQGDGIYGNATTFRTRFLGKKIEWGISDKLQISTFVHVLQSTQSDRFDYNGNGRLGSRERYTWATVGSPFTHVVKTVYSTRDFLRAIPLSG